MEEVKPTTLHAAAINQLVKDGLVGVNEKVKEAIVSSLVKEEVDRRIRATTTIFQKREALEKDNRKIKPKFLGYDEHGVPKGDPIFTKEEADQLKKNKEQLDKLDRALAKALDDSDFTKVFELAGNQ